MRLFVDQVKNCSVISISHNLIPVKKFFTYPNSVVATILTKLFQNLILL